MMKVGLVLLLIMTMCLGYIRGRPYLHKNRAFPRTSRGYHDISKLVRKVYQLRLDKSLFRFIMLELLKDSRSRLHKRTQSMEDLLFDSDSTIPVKRFLQTNPSKQQFGGGNLEEYMDMPLSSELLTPLAGCKPDRYTFLNYLRTGLVCGWRVRGKYHLFR